jgi:DNA gyrase subunit A
MIYLNTNAITSKGTVKDVTSELLSLKPGDKMLISTKTNAADDRSDATAAAVRASASAAARGAASAWNAASDKAIAVGARMKNGAAAVRAGLKAGLEATESNDVELRPLLHSDGDAVSDDTSSSSSDDDDADFVEQLYVSSSHDDLLCFTNTGRVFKMKVWQIPEAARTAKGRAIQNLLELRPDERICTWRPVAKFEQREDFLFFLTANGQVKRTALQEYRNVNKSGIIALGLKEGDRLVDVLVTSGNSHVLLSTAQGMSIRFDENDARVMGRSAAGVIGIDLADGDDVVGGIVCDDTLDLFTACESGFGKRTPMKEYLVQSEDGSTRAQSRGGKGRIDIRTEGRNGRVVAVRSVTDTDSLIFSTKSGMVVRIRAADVLQVGRNSQGVKLVSLDTGDALASVAKIEQGDEPVEAAPASEVTPPTPEAPQS